MIFDWFTIVAQVLNFLILVWLLKRFLYKPVLHAIDERERGIAAKLADAAGLEQKAQADSFELHHKNEEFDQERAGLLLTAVQVAQKERERLMEDAHRAASEASLSQAKAHREETQTLLQAVGAQAQQELVAMTRKILTDLADTDLEASMVQVFLRRLRALSGPEKLALGVSAPGSKPLVVRTGLEISATLQDLVRATLHDVLGATSVRFETSPPLVCGIEMTAQGHKVAWSVAGYLTTLEKGIGALLENGQPDAG